MEPEEPTEQEREIRRRQDAAIRDFISTDYTAADMQRMREAGARVARERESRFLKAFLGN